MQQTLVAVLFGLFALAVMLASPTAAAPSFLPPGVGAGDYLTATNFSVDPTGRNNSQSGLQTALNQAKSQSAFPRFFITFARCQANADRKFRLPPKRLSRLFPLSFLFGGFL